MHDPSGLVSNEGQLRIFAKNEWSLKGMLRLVILFELALLSLKLRQQVPLSASAWLARSEGNRDCAASATKGTKSARICLRSSGAPPGVEGPSVAVTALAQDEDRSSAASRV
jgi:hypothetical protein